MPFLIKKEVRKNRGIRDIPPKSGQRNMAKNFGKNKIAKKSGNPGTKSK